MMKYHNEHTIIYLDGEFVNAKSAHIDIYNQALHYGYGVFEGLRAYNTHNGTRIFKAEEHFERLKKSCEAIDLPFHWNIKELVAQSYELLKLNNLREAYIRPLVMSGSNMHLTTTNEARIIIAAWEWAPYLGHNLIKVTVSDIKRPDSASFPVTSKITGQYVNSILASSKALKNGFDEALLLDKDNFVAQASSENLFIEKDFVIYTPPLENVFPGLTRETVIQICKDLNIEIIEKKLTIEEVKAAEGAFLSGTAAEIIGIQQVDDHMYKERWEDTIGASIQRRYKNLVLENENYEVII